MDGSPQLRGTLPTVGHLPDSKRVLSPGIADLFHNVGDGFRSDRTVNSRDGSIGRIPTLGFLFQPLPPILAYRSRMPGNNSRMLISRTADSSADPDADFPASENRGAARRANFRGDAITPRKGRSATWIQVGLTFSVFRAPRRSSSALFETLANAKSDSALADESLSLFN